MSTNKLTALVQALIQDHGISPLDDRKKGVAFFTLPGRFVGVKVDMTVYPIGLVKADGLSSNEIVEYSDRFYEVARSLSFSDFMGVLDPRRLTAKLGFLGFVFEAGADPASIQLITSQKRGSYLTFGSAFTTSWVLDCRSLEVHTHTGRPVANRTGFYFDKNSLEAVLKSVVLEQLSGPQQTWRNAPAPRQTPASAAGEHKIFISYRRADSVDISGRIYDRLAARFGPAAVFKDVDSIPLGVNFKEYLNEQVRECKVVLAIIGRHWLHTTSPEGSERLQDPTDFVRIEIEAALKQNIPLIPLLVSGAVMPAAEDLPASLTELTYRNGIQIRPDPDFHRDMDRLIAGLEQHLIRKSI